MKTLKLYDFNPRGPVTIKLQLHAVPPADAVYLIFPTVLGVLELSPSDSDTFLKFLSDQPRKKIVEPELTYMRCDDSELGFHINDSDLTRMLSSDVNRT